MALTFNGSSDKIDFGSGVSLDNLTNLTYILWMRPGATAQGCGLLTKGTSAGASRRSFELRNSVTATAIFGIVDLATTDASAETPTNAYAANAWICAAMTFNDSTKVVELFTGTLSSLMASQTSAAAGSGATGDNSANNQWGSAYGGGTTGFFNGRIAHAAIFSSVLSLANLQSWQRRPRKSVAGVSAVGFWRLGNEGTGSQQDYSGNANAGTPTGTTQSAGPPLDEGELYLPMTENNPILENGVWRYAA